MLCCMFFVINQNPVILKLDNLSYLNIKSKYNIIITKINENNIFSFICLMVSSSEFSKIILLSIYLYSI